MDEEELVHELRKIIFDDDAFLFLQILLAEETDLEGKIQFVVDSLRIEILPTKVKGGCLAPTINVYMEPPTGELEHYTK
ncbi:hypothetical protein SCP_1402730 [Sparassis crispa]|uniref:Uncharacterized protein n=1 Tax=Sparassis crispa TaxID=139825 RepID=A0A401H344_9APHY|nr:hypothetical protein SCP_1402730 [Sparassis crispa]GBE88865.1 hypothetical protein SCP_1402730 [Sparassis crispa]